MSIENLRFILNADLSVVNTNLAREQKKGDIEYQKHGEMMKAYITKLLKELNNSDNALILRKRRIEGVKTAYISLDVSLIESGRLSRGKEYRITIEEVK